MAFFFSRRQWISHMAKHPSQGIYRIGIDSGNTMIYH